jgi:uncharacterized protein
VPRPGVDLEIVEDVETSGPILDTGQGFFAGMTERGPTLSKVHSESEFSELFGGRVVDQYFHDGVTSFFSEGGGTAIISRDATNGGSASATAALGDMIVDAIGPGLWGNDVSVEAEYAAGSDAAGEPIYLTVAYDGTIIERSPTLRSVGEAIQWADDNSKYVRISTQAAAPTLPAGNTVADLATGLDGASSEVAFRGALDRFSYELGPGQLHAPGNVDPAYHLAMAEHTVSNHRVGIVDLPDDIDPLVLTAARAEFDNEPGSRNILAMGDWLRYPFSTSPASVVIPYSGVQGGIIARVDKGGDIAAVAAGSNGISRRALGLAQQRTNADKTELNANGVTLGRQMYGLVRTYGYRTAAGPDLRGNWTFFQESRVIMSIAHRSNAALEEYVFDTVDGLGHLFVQVKNMLTGVVNEFYRAGSLYGQTPAQAFRVVCDFSNNPLDTIRLGEIHADVYVRTSKIAEWIKINLIKVPTEQEV